MDEVIIVVTRKPLSASSSLIEPKYRSSGAKQPRWSGRRSIPFQRSLVPFVHKNPIVSTARKIIIDQKPSAGEAYRAVTESAIHVFGGVGFTWEHDAHLLYRRAWSAERLAGGPQAHRAAISDLAAGRDSLPPVPPIDSTTGGGTGEGMGDDRSGRRTGRA